MIYPCYSMQDMEKIKIVRHLEEVASGHIDRDADIEPVDQKEMDRLMNQYLPSIIEDIKSGKYNKMVFVSSDKIRSKRTAEILKKEAGRQLDIPIDIETDPRTSAEGHGEYKKGVTPKDPLIKVAKMAFVKESFENKNPWYRHGSVATENNPSAYPELAKIFESSGENQIEISIRMYRFILDLLEKVRENPKTLYVLTVHHIVMSTILTLLHLLEKKGKFINLIYHPAGEMHTDTTKAVEEMVGGWDKFYEYYSNHNYLFDVDPAQLGEMEEIIRTELDILLAQYMQHYGKSI